MKNDLREMDSKNVRKCIRQDGEERSLMYSEIFSEKWDLPMIKWLRYTHTTNTATCS
jgi:hypothetical protein